MKYRIEVWIYGAEYERYESDDIQDVLDWWKNNWFTTYDNGGCAFYVYEEERELSFDEVYKLGFA